MNQQEAHDFLAETLEKVAVLLPPVHDRSSGFLRFVEQERSPLWVFRSDAYSDYLSTKAVTESGSELRVNIKLKSVPFGVSSPVNILHAEVGVSWCGNHQMSVSQATAFAAEYMELAIAAAKIDVLLQQTMRRVGSLPVDKHEAVLEQLFDTWHTQWRQVQEAYKKSTKEPEPDSL